MRKQEGEVSCGRLKTAAKENVKPQQLWTVIKFEVF